MNVVIFFGGGIICIKIFCLEILVGDYVCMKFVKGIKLIFFVFFVVLCLCFELF